MTIVSLDDDEALVHQVIGAFYHVYNKLGYGFREKIYSAAMQRTLVKRDMRVRREAPVRIFFEGELIAIDAADMLVNERLVVENKAGHYLDPTAPGQLFNYLRGSEIKSGILFHFGPKPRFYRQLLKDGMY